MPPLQPYVKTSRRWAETQSIGIELRVQMSLFINIQSAHIAYASGRVNFDQSRLSLSAGPRVCADGARFICSRVSGFGSANLEED